MKKRVWLIALAAGCLTVVVLPRAHARPAPGAAVYIPSFASVQDWSQCDDGDGSAVCTASAASSQIGTIATTASLRPVGTLATGGRAEGRGGPQISHRLAAASTAVRFRFYFEDVSATARKDPTLARDIEARAVAAGFAYHAGCRTCAVQSATLVADADAFSPEPSEVTGRSLRVDVEMRKPGGKVPKGVTIATGFLLSDVGLYENVPGFTSSANAATRGRLVRVEVEPVA